MEQCCLHHSAPLLQQLPCPASCVDQQKLMLVLWVLLQLLLFAVVLGCQ
jgi:hypothetical protein